MQTNLPQKGPRPGLLPVAENRKMTHEEDEILQVEEKLDLNQDPDHIHLIHRTARKSRTGDVDQSPKSKDW